MKSIKFNPETSVAIADMFAALQERTGGLRFTTQREAADQLQRFIVAMSQAIVNYEPEFNTEDEFTRQIAWNKPLAFDARFETQEEIDLRVLCLRLAEVEVAHE